MAEGLRSRRATSRLVDVARHAGVSAQTVSNVINDRGGFTDATYRRVIAAVEDLRYRPNRSARNLRLRRAQQIGFHMTGAQLDARNPFAITFLRGLVAAADAAGFEVVVFTHLNDDAAEFRKTVSSQSVDGFVLSDCQEDDLRALTLAELGIPFAAFGRLSPNLPQACVDIDNAAAMGSMVDYLVGEGHRSFGYVSYPGPEYWTIDRLHGVRSRLKHHGVHLSKASTCFGRPESIGPGVRALLGRRRPPTVLITGSDSLALPAANIAHRMGLSIGSDVCITGFDAGPLQLLAGPPLTSVAVPVEPIASAVMDRLLIEMETGPTDLPGLLIPTELTLLGSTA